MAFGFLDPGPLIDAELELIAPDARWIDAMLRSCAHPLSASDSATAGMTRSRAMDFLRAAPQGRQAGDLHSGRVPSYHFWMRLRPLTAQPRMAPGHGLPPVEIAGGLALRIGNNFDLEMYLGHIGYNVYPPARGCHYAERACRLVLPLARAHGMKRLWITCNPDNWASRRTCQRLGCQLAQIVPVPSHHSLYMRGDREKCRYWLDL